jgi:hypothetical protein
MRSGSFRDRAAFTIDEFCESHRISRSAFYKMLADGTGPKVMKVLSRTMISVEAAADWRRRCEEEAERQRAEAEAESEAV